MVPEDRGWLRSTGRVESFKGPRGSKTWQIVYGGTTPDGNVVDYANHVHDDLRPRNYTRAGSGPKFLEVHAFRRSEQFGLDMDHELADAVISLFGQN